MARAQNLYEKTVDICTDYLGPAGERFMRRQIATHLGKAPEQLSRDDLPELSNWVRLAFAMLTDDSRVTEEFSSRLHKLYKEQDAPRRKRSGD